MEFTGLSQTARLFVVGLHNIYRLLSGITISAFAILMLQVSAICKGASYPSLKLHLQGYPIFCFVKAKAQSHCLYLPHPLISSVTMAIGAELQRVVVKSSLQNGTNLQ